MIRHNIGHPNSYVLTVQVVLIQIIFWKLISQNLSRAWVSMGATGAWHLQNFWTVLSGTHRFLKFYYIMLCLTLRKWLAPAISNSQLKPCFGCKRWWYPKDQHYTGSCTCTHCNCANPFPALSRIVFVHFLEVLETPKRHFEINSLQFKQISSVKNYYLIIM